MNSCVTCGRPPRPDGPGEAAPVTWTRQTGRDGRDELICPDCTREHLRSLEARLEPEWW